METFVINLDRRADRWFFMSEQLARLGLEYSRVAAIDGLSLEDSDRALVPRSVDACWRSHQKVYALLASKPTNTAGLILEDDAVLSSSVNWSRLLNDCEAFMMRESIDVLQLGFLPDTNISRLGVLVRGAVERSLNLVFREPDNERLAPAPSVDNRWDCLAHAPAGLKLVPDSFGAGTHCYMISSRAAGTLIGLNTPTFTAPDDFFMTVTRDQEVYRRFRVARVKQNLADQRNRMIGTDTDSDIEVDYPGAAGSR